jgi:predicted kinase
MKPTVYMMLGLPGSGKTTFSRELERKLHVSRLSLDEEYARFGGDLTSRHWDKESDAMAKAHINARLEALVDQGESAILDFCPWKEGERTAYRQYLESLGAVSYVYYFDVPHETLLKRLAARNIANAGDTHVVTPEMLENFIKRFDPPSHETHERINS